MTNTFKQILTIVSGLTLALVAHSNQTNPAEPVNSGAVDNFYVGSDKACDFSTIESALIAASNSQNAVEIRIADNKNYHEFISVDLSNVLIDGNYANCADARNNITGGNRAKLLGFLGTNLPLIRITGLFVHIKDLQLQGNDGGGIIASSTSVITLEDMFFFQLGNPGLQTSGNGQIDVRIKNSIFLLNTATIGAAINCTGFNHSIEVTEGTGFANNSVTRSGGAVNLENCDFSMTSGGFQNNNSSGDGGGLNTLNSTVTLKNVTFDSNTASSAGGAINTESSNIYSEAMKFIDNEATFGGAISVDNADVSNVSFELKANSQSCTKNIKCNYFEGNKAQKGGALMLGTGFSGNGKIDISSTFFENNRADFGTVISAPATGTVKIEGSIFSHNGNHAADGFDDRSVIAIGTIAEVTIAYSTFADNKVLFSTFKQNEDAVLGVFSSIIYDSESGDVFEANGLNTTLDTHCLIVHENSSFDTTNDEVIVADPVFVDPENGDYHINAALSPAVDYCTDNMAMAQYRDIDGEERGFDDPDVSNNFTNATFDIGADETYSNDIIFADGFE